MFIKHMYKNLDEVIVRNYYAGNPSIEISMKEIATLVFDTNYGLQRFVSYYDDLAKESGVDWRMEQAKALIEAMEKCE